MSCVRWRTRHWRVRNGRPEGRHRSEPDGRRAALRLRALHRHEPHRRAHGRLGDGLRIGPVVRRAIAGPSTIPFPPHSASLRRASRKPPARAGPRDRATAPAAPSDVMSRTLPSPLRKPALRPAATTAASSTSPGWTGSLRPPLIARTWKLPFARSIASMPIFGLHRCALRVVLQNRHRIPDAVRLQGPGQPPHQVRRWHVTCKYQTNWFEGDHAVLKHRLQPMRRL